jgi:hypothetical protein
VFVISIPQLCVESCQHSSAGAHHKHHTCLVQQRHTWLCLHSQIEDIGPVSYCGGAPPSAQRAAAASAAGVAAGSCDTKKKM